MIGKYSFYNVMKVYNDHKPLITAYINGKSIEGIDNSLPPEKNVDLAAYGGLTMFIAILVIHIILAIWALVAIYTHWKKMSGIVKALSLILWFSGGPIFSLILVYVASEEKNTSPSSFSRK